MRSAGSSSSPLRHHHVDVDGLAVHVVEAGALRKPTALFLHGWPENWRAFERIMLRLALDTHTVAIDLPGIGGSETPPASHDKRTLARYVRGVIQSLNLEIVTLVGHDVGGQIVYSYLHAYPGELHKAVIMNVAIPGVEWYRAFAQDERDNLEVRRETVSTPVLYMRGEVDRGFDIERHVQGLHEGGLLNVTGRIIPLSGHFALDERPDEVADVLQQFIRLTD